jgi:hypothetical protein
MVRWASTGLSDYWFDGYQIGTNYSPNMTHIFTAEPTALLGIKFAGGFGSASTNFYIDNLKCYHF